MEAATPERQSFAPANPKPCKDCPWRVENFRRKGDKHGFYTLKNLRRLWRGLRSGERMTCHPTDPHMSDFAGYERTAARQVTHECTGAVVLVQREIMRAQDCMEEAEREGKKDGWQRYRKRFPKGLTKDGLAQHIWVALTGRSGLAESDPMPVSKPNLNQDGIHHPDLVPWEKRRA